MGMKGGTTNYPMGPGSNPIGMMGMDLSMHNMPVIGSFFQNPNELHQREQMSKAAEAMTAYRPEYAQARMNALGNTLSVMQPVQNALNRMYGEGGNMNTAQAMTSPMGPSMMQQGAAMPSRNPNQLPDGGKFGGKLGGKLGGKGGKGNRRNPNGFPLVGPSSLDQLGIPQDGGRHIADLNQLQNFRDPSSGIGRF